MRLVENNNAQQQMSAATLADERLRDGVVALVASLTSRRFAAVYPVTHAVVAINDGASIQTHRCEPLHHDVEAALAAGGGSRDVTWLLADVDEPSLRVVAVRAATELLASPFVPAAARRAPAPWRDAGAAPGWTIASRRRDDGAPGCG